MLHKIKITLKKHIHKPLILFGHRIAGKRYAKNPRKRAEQLFMKDFGRAIDWQNPKLYVEKIRWIQFNTDISYWSQLADKYNARKFVAEKGHHETLLPIYGKWDQTSDIDFDSLPESFVIKPNNGCGDLFIVPDKINADLKRIRRILGNSMRQTYGGFNAETHYRDIPPCIFAEALIPSDNNSKGITDYKFFWCDGEPIMCMVCADRDYDGPETKKVAIYDMDWNRRDEWLRQHCKSTSIDMPVPASFEEMKVVCRDLTKGMPFVRLDLYDDNGNVRFGEFTFTPAALKRNVTLSETAMQFIADKIPTDHLDKDYILSVTISTIGEAGIKRTASMQLPALQGVEYVISWQKNDGIALPDTLKREDIHVIRTASVGLSNNRNNAIKYARGEIILIADDDLDYRADQLQSIIDTFKSHPELDLASFRYHKPVGKKYPEQSVPFDQLPKGFSPVSFEIAFRQKIVKGADAITFNPLLGLGASYLKAGEEDFFLMQAIAKGYRGAYFPIEITTHKGVATGGRKITDYGVLRANGAIIALRRPILWPVAIILNSVRINRVGRAPFLRSLFEMTKGALYRFRHLKI